MLREPRQFLYGQSAEAHVLYAVQSVLFVLSHDILYAVILSQDKYGTQRVVSFLRQLTEQGGFWRSSDRSWVKLNRVQFVGACNPPTDAGALNTCYFPIFYVRGDP